MVITKKIEKTEKDLEEEREKVILKGGQVSSDIEKIKGERRWPIVLRIPPDFLEKIDQSVKKRIGFNRHAWLLEAAQEKLEKDQ